MSFAWKIATGEADRVTRRTFNCAAAVMLLLSVAACSGFQSESESLPPQSVSQATLEDSEFEEYVVTEEDEPVYEEVEPVYEEVEPAVVQEESEPQPVRDDVVVADDLVLEEDDSVTVIENQVAAAGEREMTLVDSARAERSRRGLTQETQIVINDKNLSDYATGQLTETESSTTVITNESLGSETQDEIDLALDEAYWRDRGYEIRLAWKEAGERVEVLEGDVFNLRMRFYAEDDPFYRDAQIKPAWDHAIEELNRAREEIELKPQELGEFMEEGRVAGALPGWLREGIELEPVQPVEEGVGISRPGEPDLMDEEITDPVVAPDPGGDGA
jgi:hypothetical protein